VCEGGSCECGGSGIVSMQWEGLWYKREKSEGRRVGDG